MSEDFNPEFVLSSGGPVVCPQCGGENGQTDRHCQQCGTALPLEDDDDTTFETVSADGVGGVRFRKKVTVSESKHLRTLREAALGVADGSVTREAYLASVEEVTRVAFLGTELFKSDVVRTKVATLPEEEAAITNQIAAQFDAYLAGCQRMQQYLTSSNLEDANVGLAMVETAMTAMDKARERALEIANARVS